MNKISIFPSECNQNVRCSSKGNKNTITNRRPHIFAKKSNELNFLLFPQNKVKNTWTVGKRQ